ncbi:MAG: hypothetical protein AAB368_04880, partial [bacterium]
LSASVPLTRPVVFEMTYRAPHPVALVANVLYRSRTEYFPFLEFAPGAREARVYEVLSEPRPVSHRASAEGVGAGAEWTRGVYPRLYEDAAAVARSRGWSPEAMTIIRLGFDTGAMANRIEVDRIAVSALPAWESPPSGR